MIPVPSCIHGPFDPDKTIRGAFERRLGYIDGADFRHFGLAPLVRAIPAQTPPADRDELGVIQRWNPTIFIDCPILC
jgi:hypothetical protein